MTKRYMKVSKKIKEKELEDKDDVPIPKQEKRIQIRFYINYIKGLLKPNEENLIKVRADEIPKLITNLQKPMVKKKLK
jgi:hypothetical protein